MFATSDYSPLLNWLKNKETREPLVPFGKDPEGTMKKILGMLIAEGFWTYSHENMILVALHSPSLKQN